MNELEHHQLKMRKEKAWGMGFLIVVFTSLIIGGTVLTNWMVDEQQVPISSVQISGHYTYIKDRDISRLIANDIELSLIHI